MRNPAVAHIYGHGRSRSKPLHKRTHKNIMIQHRGYLKMQAWLEHVIKKTYVPQKINMKKSRFAIKQAMNNMFSKKPTAKKKLNLNLKGLR